MNKVWFLAAALCFGTSPAAAGPREPSDFGAQFNRAAVMLDHGTRAALKQCKSTYNAYCDYSTGRFIFAALVNNGQDRVTTVMLRNLTDEMLLDQFLRRDIIRVADIAGTALTGRSSRVSAAYKAVEAYLSTGHAGEGNGEVTVYMSRSNNNRVSLSITAN